MLGPSRDRMVSMVNGNNGSIKRSYGDQGKWKFWALVMSLWYLKPTKELCHNFWGALSGLGTGTICSSYPLLGGPDINDYDFTVQG